MSKRSVFRRTPKFKPEARVVSNNQSNPRLNVNMFRKDKVEYLPEPIKSVADKKSYKTIRLGNGLTALLISDPRRVPRVEPNQSSEEETSGSESNPDSESGRSTNSSHSDSHGTKTRGEPDDEKLAACALTVGVGSYSDPPDIQGLAHFVEHMVFMGSEKYPKENEFDSFIKKKGGSDNASTDCEATTFYFEIQEKYLRQAMDMFSQFFVSPLMLKDSMQREREAIESEFAIATPSDANRKDQLLSSLFPEGHPARTFTWGNLKSLKDEVNDDEKLHRAAHEFRRRHYSAHRMTVAVQARIDLESLEQYVVNTFGHIPTNKLPADDFSGFSYRPDYVTPEFRSIYYVKPINDVSEVHITWCLRSLISEYESKPHQYISYLLGHEGKGSLLSYLRKKVWALGIYTGNSETGIDYSTMYSLFSTQVILTKDGLEHVHEVLEAMFSYINMLKSLGPSERIFEEIQAIEATSFRFEEESQPSDYVESISQNMHFYPPEHYITGDRLYYKYDPELITELLDCMSPDAANIMILSNKHRYPIEYDQKEKWFGTEFKRKTIPTRWMERWVNVRPFPDLHIPERNIYLTNNFDLIPPARPYVETAERVGVDLYNTLASEIRKKVAAVPVETKTLRHGDLMATVKNFTLDEPNLLRKNNRLELWYKPDFKFRFPTALLYFYFITPLSLKSPKDACLLDLYNDALQHALKEEIYPANMADLHHSIFVSDVGLMLKVHGYNQNLHLVVQLITREMRDATRDLSESMFEAVREARARTYHNVLLKPHKLSKDVRMNIILEPYISARSKARIVNELTLEDLQDFGERLFDKMYLQVLVQGNMAWHDAVWIAERVVDDLEWQREIPSSQLPEIKVRQLPLGENIVRVFNLNSDSTNSVVVNYYQAEAATKNDTAILEILLMLMEEPVFDTLRTKEQLGYSVFSMLRYTFGVLGCSITVNPQADKFSVAHVDRRIEAFLAKYTRDMRKLNDKTLATSKQALVQLKHTTDYELKEEVERNWREITGRHYKFHRLLEEGDAIEQVSLPEIKAWVDDHMATGNRSKFRKLSVQITGHRPESRQNLLKVPGNYSLSYLDANTPIDDVSESNDTFITDIHEFSRGLPIIETKPTELEQC